jgi:hypothetical protein
VYKSVNDIETGSDLHASLSELSHSSKETIASITKEKELMKQECDEKDARIADLKSERQEMEILAVEREEDSAQKQKVIVGKQILSTVIAVLIDWIEYRTQ